jgi:hypothetical protein
MPESERRITAADILPAADYAKRRKELRTERIAEKRARSIHVGPHVTMLFESYASMWLQVQEMLHIEKGGEEQLADELAAYNPMIPQGSELTATMMIEVEDPVQRARLLARLGHIEDHVALRVGGERIVATPEGDTDRTNAAGKASAVHFFHFPFTAAQITAFSDPPVEVMVEVAHPNYGHIAIMPAAMRAELAKDFA